MHQGEREIQANVRLVHAAQFQKVTEVQGSYLQTSIPPSVELKEGQVANAAAQPFLEITGETGGPALTPGETQSPVNYSGGPLQ